MNASPVMIAPAVEFRLGKLRARIWTLVGFFFLAACNGTAQSAPENADGISRLTRPLILDGEMGDPGWKSATRYADFKIRDPAAGQSPSERTDAYLAYDAATLYVAIQNFDDEPKKKRALATTGDDAWKDDWTVLCLNPYDEALNGLFFLVTPGNIRSSGALDAGNKLRLSVDMNWESRASLDGRLDIPCQIIVVSHLHSNQSSQSGRSGLAFNQKT